MEHLETTAHFITSSFIENHQWLGNTLSKYSDELKDLIQSDISRFVIAPIIRKYLDLLGEYQKVLEFNKALLTEAAKLREENRELKTHIEQVVVVNTEESKEAAEQTEKQQPPSGFSLWNPFGLRNTR